MNEFELRGWQIVGMVAKEAHSRYGLVLYGSVISDADRMEINFASPTINYQFGVSIHKRAMNDEDMLGLNIASLLQSVRSMAEVRDARR